MRYAGVALLLVACTGAEPGTCTSTAQCTASELCLDQRCQPKPDLVQGGADLALVGCAKDVDCKGLRICMKGECVDPPTPDMATQPDLAICQADVETDVDNCGKCGNVCPIPNNAAPACITGKCGVGGCDQGYANCDGNAINGCEENIASGIFDCGGCGKTCSTSNINRTCMNGVCNGTCLPGFDDCNNDKQLDGCEQNTTTDPKNCGGCGKVCPINQVCQAGACK